MKIEDGANRAARKSNHQVWMMLSEEEVKALLEGKYLSQYDPLTDTERCIIINPEANAPLSGKCTVYYDDEHGVPIWYSSMNLAHR